MRFREFFNHNYVAITFIGLFFFLSVLVGILFFQTCYLYKKVEAMVVLQEQYRSYGKKIKNKNYLETEFVLEDIDKNSIDKDRIDKNQDYWGVRGDSFIVVDRDLGYLKKSMVSYLKKINLQDLLSRINIHDWEDYSGSMRIDTPIAGAKTRAKAGNQTNKQIHKIKNNKISSRPDNNRLGKLQNKKTRQTNRPINQSTNQNSTQVNRRQHVVRSPASSFFIWPIDRDKFWLSSFFGFRKKANGTWDKHGGIDMAANKGTEVKAVAAGIVIESRYASGYGNMIVLHHGTIYGVVYKTRFAHLDKIFVKRGERVEKGQVIGVVGDTGRIRKQGKDGSHLHFEVYNYNTRINPLAILPVLR